MKYARIVNGFIEQIVESSYPQEEMSIIDFDIPKCPGIMYRFNVNSMQWEQNQDDAISLIKKEEVKLDRNLLLQQSDWTQLPDVPLETKQAWATYRQALRDITTQEGYPFNVIWPTKPE